MCTYARDLLPSLLLVNTCLLRVEVDVSVVDCHCGSDCTIVTADELQYVHSVTFSRIGLRKLLVVHQACMHLSMSEANNIEQVILRKSSYKYHISKSINLMHHSVKGYDVILQL